MLKGDFCTQIASEMARYFTDRNGWTSNLYEYGTIGLLGELLTAGKAASNGILSDGSFDDLKEQAVERVLCDRGLGDVRMRGTLRNYLPKRASEFRPSSFKYRAIQGLLPSLRGAYLANWCTELAKEQYSSWPTIKKGDSTEPPVVAAGLIASFLIEEGVSPAYLSRWLDYRQTHSAEEIDLGNLISQFADLHKKGRKPIEILVLLEQTVNPEIRESLSLLSASDTKTWLQSNNFELSRGAASRLHGGLVLLMDVWDIDEALFKTGIFLSRVKDRARLNGWNAPMFSTSAWLKGVPKPKRLPEKRHNSLLGGYIVDSKSLILPSSENRLEVAMEFVEAASNSGGASAAGMLWAAVESLFSGPGDPARVDAVTRASDVGVVAFVRYDLKNALATTMRHERQSSLVTILAGLDGPQRLAHFEKYLLDGDYSEISHQRILTRLQHTASLLSPDGIAACRKKLQKCLRALYRQRNLVLHGGINDAPLLDSILRGAYPLVGAIVDRYAKDSQETGSDPYMFATTANLKIERYIWEPNSILSVF